MKFVMLHGYSDSNKGDLAIVVASIHALRELYPEAEIALQTVYPPEDPDFAFHHRFVNQLEIDVAPMGIPSPYADAKQHSFSRNLAAAWALFRNATIQTLLYAVPRLRSAFPTEAKPLDQLRAADVVLLKGGQYIYNDQGGLRGLLYLWRILFPIQVARKLGKPVVMLGQSVGPVVGQRAFGMVKEALSHCQRLMVREDLSAKLMDSMGLSNITALAPDMAFLTKPRQPTSLTDETQRLSDGKWLGVTVVNWNFPGHPDSKERRHAYEQAIIKVCEQASKALGVGIALFPQVTVRHHGESDMDMILRVEAALQARSVGVISIKEDLWPDEFSYLYGKCQALIGTRLHSCILAACAGVPVIAIRYQGYKTEGVMSALGLDGYVHDINCVDEQKLLASTLNAVADRETLSSEIQRRVAGFRANLLRITKAEIDQACA